MCVIGLALHSNPWRRHRLLRQGGTGNAALWSPGQA
jgi:hypothetical protein